MEVAKINIELVSIVDFRKDTLFKHCIMQTMLIVFILALSRLNVNQVVYPIKREKLKVI